MKQKPRERPVLRARTSHVDRAVSIVGTQVSSETSALYCYHIRVGGALCSGSSPSK